LENKGEKERKRNTMTHYQIWHAIELFAHAHGLTCSALAKRSGLDPTTFNKSKRFSKYEQPRWPSTASISKILAATGAEPQDFFKFITNDTNDCGNK
jgi:phage repressor protein C with HTH and peptisase S24 domain